MEKHTLPVKAAIEELGSIYSPDRILCALAVLGSYYDGAKNTPQVRDKLVKDVSHFMQHVRDEVRRRADAGLPDPIIQKRRPPMYARHELKG